jgi:hypothetical protein
MSGHVPNRGALCTLVCDATASLIQEQRRLLLELLGEIGLCVDVVAKVKLDYPGDTRRHNLAAVSCWAHVADS